MAEAFCLCTDQTVDSPFQRKKCLLVDAVSRGHDPGGADHGSPAEGRCLMRAQETDLPRVLVHICDDSANNPLAMLLLSAD